MASSYHTAVLKLLKLAYPAAIIKEEQNLYELTKNGHLPDFLDDMIKAAKCSLSQMRVDIYIDGIGAFEVHGEQHYQEVKFSNQIEDAKKELLRRQVMDKIKQTALYFSNIPSIIINYKEIDSLTVDEIKRRVYNAQIVAGKRPSQLRRTEKPSHHRTRSESYQAYKEKQKEKARENRKSQYRRIKEWRKRQNKK